MAYPREVITGFEVLTVVSIYITVTWYVVLCSLVDRNKHFG
jgi:hypothetical protein